MSGARIFLGIMGTTIALGLFLGLSADHLGSHPPAATGSMTDAELIRGRDLASTYAKPSERLAADMVLVPAPDPLRPVRITADAPRDERARAKAPDAETKPAGRSAPEELEELEELEPRGPVAPRQEIASHAALARVETMEDAPAKRVVAVAPAPPPRAPEPPKPAPVAAVVGTRAQERVPSPATDPVSFRIVHRPQLETPLVLEEVTYTLNGEKIFSRTFPPTDKPQKQEIIAAHVGSLKPGSYDLRVSIRCGLLDYGLFTYAKGYTIKLQSHHAFRVDPGRPLELTVTPYTDSVVKKPTERLRIRFEERVKGDLPPRM